MYMNKKVVITTLFMVIFIPVIMCGCQETPDDPIVVGKNTEKPTEIVSEVPSSKIDINGKETSNWEDVIKGNNYEINVNAEIPEDLPTVTEVYDVNPHSFTQEEAVRFVNSILGDVSVFQYADPTILSKEEIEKKIIEIRKLMATGNGGGGYFYTDPVTKEELDLPAEEYIERLEKDYAYAPEKKERIYNDITLSKEGTSEQLYVLAEMDSDSLSSVFINNNPATNSYVMQYQFNKDRLDYSDTELLEDSQDNINGCSLTREEALNKAQNLIDSIVGDSLHYDCQEIYIGSFRRPDEELDPFEKPTEDELYDKEKQAYILCFTKKYGDIDTSYIKFYYDSIIDGLEESYQPIYQSESIEVCINDDGIQFLEWINPDTIMGSTQEQLLSVDEIKERFIEQCHLMNWAVEDEYTEIAVNKVCFGMMRVAKKDAPNTYQVVPVWDFMGYIEGEQRSNYLQSLLTINAIDGSIINRAMNY